MAYVITCCNHAISRRALRGLGKDKWVHDTVRRNYTHVMRSNTSLMDILHRSDIKLNAFVFKSKSWGEKKLECIASIKNEQTKSDLPINLSEWKLVEVPDRLATPPPRPCTISVNDPGYIKYRNTVRLDKEPRQLSYCINCRHIIPKGLMRLGIKRSWGICPMCIVEIAPEFSRAIDAYDQSFIEEMRVNRALEHL